MKMPVTWVLISLASFISLPVMAYCEGRSNSVWVVPPLLPADIVPLLLMLVSVFVLFFTWLRSMRAKSRGFGKGLMFGASLGLFLASFAMDRPGLYARGFHDYAKNVLTAEEWRSISRFAQAHLKPGEVLHGRSKNLWDEKTDRALWDELVATTPIQRLNPALMIFVHPDCTEIVWGGALVGHRGVTIATEKSDVFQRNGSSNTKFIAEDIATSIMD